MSDRERWIVYPLLFYALMMGFKANYSEPLEFRCQTIACRNLQVKERIQANALSVQLINNNQSWTGFPVPAATPSDVSTSRATPPVNPTPQPGPVTTASASSDPPSPDAVRQEGDADPAATNGTPQGP